MEQYDYTVDFSEVENYMDIHEVLKRDLEFPDYYGGNLDALNDCLTDMLSEISFIQMKGFEDLDKRFDGSFSEILQIFKRTRHLYNDKYFNTFHVTLVYKDGSQEEVV